MFNLKYRPHYFSHHLNREVEEVYWHAILNGLALSLFFIFEPIYLYSLGYKLTQILWFYVQVYVWYAILISFGAKFASRFGYKHAILISNFFYILYWGVLFSISTQPSFFSRPFVICRAKIVVLAGVRRGGSYCHDSRESPGRKRSGRTVFHQPAGFHCWAVFRRRTF